MRAAMTAVVQHGIKGAPGCLIAEKGPVSCAGVEAEEAEGAARVRGAQQILRRTGTESLCQSMIGPGATLTCLMVSSIDCSPATTDTGWHVYEHMHPNARPQMHDWVSNADTAKL